MYQSIVLKEKPDSKVLAVTWGNDSFGYRRAFKIHEDIKELVDEFISDFRTANMKQIETK